MTETRRGYKQTEVGVIPEDWGIKSCLSVSDLITVGIVIQPTQYYVKQGVPALRSANVRDDGVDENDLVFISERANAVLSKSQLRAGDVLTVRTGHPGTTAVVPPHLAGSNCIDILITRPSKSINSHYLAAWLNSPVGKYQVLRNQGGLAQQHFNVGDLRDLLVALPPTLAEQEAIAEALSDADALIESLEQLLTKRRQIKQGAMQELLTGKKRLPGFDGEWKTAPLEHAATLQRGFDLPQRLRKQGSFPIVTSSGIEDWHSEAKVQAPGVVTGRYGTIGEVFFVRRDFWPLNTTLYVRDFHGNDPFFISYLLRTIDFHTHSGKSGVPGVNRNDLHQIAVSFPSALAEQTAIATVLSDMDAELSSLETKLAKARQLKQGMMQELLTGRTRLV
ncbi:MAG: restriction endonuclease subunit S [Polyangia bacterium]